MIVVNSKTLRIRVDTPLLSRKFWTKYKYEVDGSVILLIRDGDVAIEKGDKSYAIRGMECNKCKCRIRFTGISWSINETKLKLSVVCDCEHGKIILEKAR